MKKTPLYEVLPLNTDESKKEPRPGVLRVITDKIFSVSDIANKDDNRNSRLYSESLLRNRIVDSKYTKELLERGCLCGEADHPKERLEVKLTEISHRITELHYKDGFVRGSLEILDTPSGRICNTLIDAGAILGISSRGAGSTVAEGSKIRVNEDDYFFYTFDLVLSPGFASALLPTSESIEAHVPDSDVYQQALTRLVNTADHSTLNILETILSQADQSLFGPTIQTIREKLNPPAPETTLSLLEEAHRELFDVRKENESLFEQATELRQKIQLLESANLVLQSDACDEQSQLDGMRVVLESTKNELNRSKEQIALLEVQLIPQSTLFEQNDELKQQNKNLLTEREQLRGTIIDYLVLKTGHPQEVVEQFMGDIDPESLKGSINTLQNLRRSSSAQPIVQKKTSIESSRLPVLNENHQETTRLTNLVRAVGSN